jgi:hypothetical protein
MLANETVGNMQDSSYDSILENAQRTVFLKELFSQVDVDSKDWKTKNCLFVVLAV